ncbi:MAG: hypothetical protein AAF636_02790 [Pseudomonadota bacterium]
MSAAPLARSNRIERLSRAANPALFEAAIDPQLLTVLMLANLMSPTLWQLKDKVLARAQAKYPDEEELQQSHITLEMLAYVNHHFTHDYPMSTAKKVGVSDLSTIRHRLGAEGVDYALDVIRRHFLRRAEQGLLTPDLDIFPVLEQDKFPIFNYSTIDGLRALRRLLHKKKHKPLGVTICADEATLVATLANILHGVSFRDIFLFGTPAHYTTFLRKDGARFWCNGKPEYFDKAAWQTLCDDPKVTNPDAEFSRRQPFLDRIVSPQGTLLLYNCECSIPEAAFQDFVDESCAFFGCVLEPLQTVIEAGILYLPSSEALEGLGSLDNLTSATEARAVLSDLAASYALSVFDQAFYCIRDLQVAYPGAYLAAALHGPKLCVAAGNIRSLDDAMEIVSKISGTDAVLGDRDRIALPDEVITFQTGDDVDNGLLLFSLLLSSSAFSSRDKSEAALVVTEVSSFCCWRHQIIDLKSLSFVDAISGSECMRLRQAALFE